MRFLLKPSRAVTANRSKAAASASKAAVSASSTPAADVNSSGKAWGQQCSPDCGCVLRIETQLSEGSLAASPTIVHASYHAKRVMAAAPSAGNDGRLRPLTTQHSSQSARPILTSCTCPTLHHLAQRTVDHLSGKTLAQVRNDMEMGSNGPRSSVALRHTVLREEVLPALEEAGRGKKLGIAKLGAPTQNFDHDTSEDEETCGSHEINSTQRHGRCYDLVEDSLMSMIYSRLPAPRRDSHAEAYSPTIGGHFRMYSPSQRNQPVDTDEESQSISGAMDALVSRFQDDSAGGSENRAAFHEVGDWQRRSPSSFFLFGDDPNNSSMAGILFQHAKEQIFGSETGKVQSSARVVDAKEEDRSALTYLHLLDLYGEDTSREKGQGSAKDDWLEYVDNMHYQSKWSSTG